MRLLPGLRKGGTVPVLLVAAFAAVAAAADGPPLRLRDAVAEALARNPAVASAGCALEIAEAARDESAAGFLPRIAASGALTRGNDPVYVFGSLLRQGKFSGEQLDPAVLDDPAPLRNYRVGIDATWRVFDGFSRVSLAGRAGAMVEKVRAELSEVRLQTLSAVVEAYWSAVLADRRREVAEAAVRVAEAEADAIRARFAQQLVVRSDLLSAEVRLGELRQQLLEAEGAIEIAREVLGGLLGRTGSSIPPLVREIPTGTSASPTLEAALSTGLALRGKIAAASFDVKGAELGRQAAERAFLPKIDAFATFEWNAERTSDRFGRDRTVGAVLTIPLIEPGRLARVRAARAGEAVAAAEAAATRDRVRLEIVSAWERTRSARLRVPLAEKSSAEAEEADRILGDRYREGLTTIGERLRGEAALTAARFALLSARFDALISEAELARATGGSPDVSYDE